MSLRLTFIVLALSLPSILSKYLLRQRPADHTWRGGPIDVVIPHATGSASLIDDDKKNVERDRDPGELKYQLRSFAMYAPWVNHIYILVNGDENIADWFPEPEKTSFVNRCELPGLVGNCPTRNSQAVVSVAHQVPGLAEHFILTDDDNVLVKPVQPENFFDLKTTNPYNNKWSEPELMYDSMNNVLAKHTELTLADIPQRMTKMDPGHTFVPMSRSSLEAFERDYPKWFSFLRSHRKGRYCSGSDSSGTADSDAQNCLEEMFESAVYHYWTQHPEYAAKLDPQTHPSSEGVYDHGGAPAERIRMSIDGARSKPDYYIANLNDVYSHDPDTYVHEVQEAHRTLDGYFPDGSSQ